MYETPARTPQRTQSVPLQRPVAKLLSVFTARNVQKVWIISVVEQMSKQWWATHTINLEF